MRFSFSKYLFLFCLISCYVFSQENQRQIDSIQKLLKNEKVDTSKIKHLNELLNIVSDDEVYQKYNQEVYQLCEKNIGKAKGSEKDFYLLYYASSLINKGYYVNKVSDFKQALGFYLRAMNFLNQIRKHSEDSKTALAYLYNNISSVYRDIGKLKEAIEYQKKSVALFEELGDEEGIGMVYSNLAGVYISSGDLQSAVDLNLKSINIYKKLGNQESLAAVYNNLGDLYDRRGNIKESIRYYALSYELVKNTDNKSSKAYILQNIGISYGETGNIKIGLEYLFKGLKYFEELGDKKGIYYALSNIGGIYYRDNDFENAEKYFLKSINAIKEVGYRDGMIASYYRLGNIESRKNNNQKAAEYFQKAIALSGDNIFTRMYVNTLNSIAELYKKQNNTDSSFYYYKKSIGIAEKAQFNLGKASALVSMADLHFKNGNIKESRKLAEAGFKMATDLGYAVELKNASEILYKIYKEEKNTAKALEMFELSKRMNDSLKTEEAQKAIIKSQLAAEFSKQRNSDSLKLEEQKAKDHLVLQKSKTDLSDANKRNYILLFASLLFISLAILFYKLYKSKANANLLLEKKNQEKELLMQEIHHRVKNNLQIVSGLLKMPQKHIHEENAKEIMNESRQRIHSISLIHKLLYENNNVKEVNSNQYFKELCETVIKSLSDPNRKIELELFITDVDVSIDDFVPLALILNELLLNSIKYAFMEVQHPKISIHFEKNENEYSFVYSDNGINDVTEKIKEKNSFGTKMIFNLAQQLNGFMNVAFNKGTEIKLNFPVIKT